MWWITHWQSLLPGPSQKQEKSLSFLWASPSRGWPLWSSWCWLLCSSPKSNEYYWCWKPKFGKQVLKSIVKLSFLWGNDIGLTTVGWTKFKISCTSACPILVLTFLVSVTSSTHTKHLLMNLWSAGCRVMWKCKLLILFLACSSLHKLSSVCLCPVSFWALFECACEALSFMLTVFVCFLCRGRWALCWVAGRKELLFLVCFPVMELQCHENCRSRYSFMKADKERLLLHYLIWSTVVLSPLLHEVRAAFTLLQLWTSMFFNKCLLTG